MTTRCPPGRDDRLVKVDDRRHFEILEINLETEQRRTKLKISFQLLQLAKSIPSGAQETLE